MPITRTVLDEARLHPGRTAIAVPEATLDYATLLEGGRRTWAAVQRAVSGSPMMPVPEAQGLPVVGVSLTRAFHTARIVAALAGYPVISAVLDPRWPIDHQAAVIVRAGMSVVLGQSAELAAALGERGWPGRFLTLEQFLALEEETPPAEPPTVRSGAEPFLLLFSSGTTRAPKAFMKTRYQYRQNFAVSSAHLEPLPAEATLAPGPVSYSLTLYALIESLASGGSIHLADRIDPLTALRRIRTQNITRIVAVPALLRGLLAAERHSPALAGVRLVVTGGANLSKATREEFARSAPQARLISYYGAAEIGFIGDSRSGDGTTLDIYPEVQVRVGDDPGHPLPEGELGTIWVRAAAASDDYVAGTSDEHLQKDGWASVHDQGRLVAGRLHLAGRAGDIAVTGGHKVSLTDVERAFDGMPGLGAVCALALPHPELGSVIALVAEGPGPDRQELQARARDSLAPQFVPRRWFRVPALDRTVGGKVRRSAVAERIGAAGKEVTRL